MKLTPTPKFSYVTSLGYREAGLVAHTVRGLSFGKGGPRGVSGEGIEKTTVIDSFRCSCFVSHENDRERWARWREN